MDTMHRNKVRYTTSPDGSAAPVCMVKTRIESQDVSATVPGYPRPEMLRFSCNTEVHVPAPGADSMPTLYRLKKRYSYNHKHEFLYELTEVRSGRSLAEAEEAAAECEVELEWCGQAAFASYSKLHLPHGVTVGKLLAEKMCSKVQDLLGMKLAASRASMPPSASSSGGASGSSSSGSVAPAAVRAPPHASISAAPPAPAPAAAAAAPTVVVAVHARPADGSAASGVAAVPSVAGVKRKRVEEDKKEEEAEEHERDEAGQQQAGSSSATGDADDGTAEPAAKRAATGGDSA